MTEALGSSFKTAAMNSYDSHLSAQFQDVTRAIDITRKTSPAANDISHVESQRAIVAHHKSPYDQARRYVERFNLWKNQKTSILATPDEVNLYEKPFSLKMSFDDWIKLRDDLQIFETDQKLEYSPEI